MKKILWILGAVALTFTSCNNDDDNQTTDSQVIDGGYGELSLHFHPMSGMSEFSTTETYSTPDNWNYNVQLSQFYISNISVWLDPIGSQKASFDNLNYLVKPDEMLYNLGGLPVGTYYGIDFSIGIADSATNHADPSAASGDLAPQSPSMHWSWNTGYIFVKIEGQYADSTDKTGTPVHNFAYHVGMDNMVRNVSLGHEFTVQRNVSNEVMVMVNHAAVFETIDFSQDTLTHTMNNMPLAMEVANNLVNAFSTGM